MSDMTREKAKQILEVGGRVSGRSWTFWRLGWACHGGCCQMDNYTLEETLDDIEMFCDWDEVEEDE